MYLPVWCVGCQCLVAPEVIRFVLVIRAVAVGFALLWVAAGCSGGEGDAGVADGGSSSVAEDEGLAMVGPGFDSNVSEVRFEGDTVQVFDCSRDRSEGYSLATGELVVDADHLFKARSTLFQQVDGEWKVVEFFTGGDDRCDPTSHH